MTAAHPNLADLMEDNRRLRSTIDEARRHLDNTAASLREVLDDEVIVEGTPIEIEVVMESAIDAITAASHNLKQSIAKRTARQVPGGPTRRQGQFLAYIREFMLRDHLGFAPTHAELQRFFNLAPPSVNSMLKRLDDRGFIRRTPGKTRGIELTIDPELIPTLDRPFKD